MVCLTIVNDHKSTVKLILLIRLVGSNQDKAPIILEPPIMLRIAICTTFGQEPLEYTININILK